MTQAQNVAIESSQINSSGVLLTTGGGTGLSTVGTNGQVLTSNGTTLSWVTPTTTSPGGSAGYVQYNTGSAFGGSANLYWDNTNARLGIGTSSPVSSLDVQGNVTIIDAAGYLNNLYYAGGWKYRGNGYGLSYVSDGTGAAVWSNAPNNVSGAGAAATITERMRIDSSGNVLIGTTATNRGNFTNNKLSAVISADTYATWSITNTSNAVNNTTVTALRFLDAAGNLTGGSGMAGTLFVRTTGGSGANQYLAHYSLLSGGNGTTDAGLTLLASRTRGTTPISSVNIANDGGGGAIQITITWANNSGVVTGGSAAVSFVGISI